MILPHKLRRKTPPPVIQRLKVEPGDVLVASVPHTLGAHECERLRVGMQANLPGVDVLVISDNVALSVVRGCVFRDGRLSMPGHDAEAVE